MIKNSKQRLLTITTILLAVGMGLFIYGCGKDGEPSFAVIRGATE